MPDPTERRPNDRTSRLADLLPMGRTGCYNTRVMRSAEIVKHQREEPFRPFRICLSDGSSYEVSEPHYILVTASAVEIAQPPFVDGIPDHSVYCDPIHITRITPLANGEPKTPPHRSE